MKMPSSWGTSVRGGDPHVRRSARLYSKQAVLRHSWSAPSLASANAPFCHSVATTASSIQDTGRDGSAVEIGGELVLVHGLFVGVSTLDEIPLAVLDQRDALTHRLDGVEGRVRNEVWACQQLCGMFSYLGGVWAQGLAPLPQRCPHHPHFFDGLSQQREQRQNGLLALAPLPGLGGLSVQVEALSLGDRQPLRDLLGGDRLLQFIRYRRHRGSRRYRRKIYSKLQLIGNQYVAG